MTSPFSSKVLRRRAFRRSDWMSLLLRLQRKEPDRQTPGLVLIQIDGFSHGEVQKALQRKEMPFLARLVKREHYEIRPMYTGLPSNTPAVQGELFYGVPTAVPAFSFFDSEDNRVGKMLEPESALKIERQLAAQGEGLLKGGSAYGDIYTGDADEPRWCAASMGWGTATKTPGILSLVLLALLNAYGFGRALSFAALELVLAIWDALKGIDGGERAGPEFKFILTRVGLCILMREWITAAAKMDVARGMPIVHLNFIGYDEQSHRRGPEAIFAHWVLKGIDDAIKRVWIAAKRSERRDYDVWIYSDHGQVHSLPYAVATGMTLKEKIQELHAIGSTTQDKSGKAEPGGESERIRYLGGRRLQKLFPVPGPKTDSKATQRYPIVTDLGPVALVYLHPDATDMDRRAFGAKLATEAGIPLVLDGKSKPGLHGWSSKGPFTLPADMEMILGNHPFRAQLLPDLERLCRHSLAGDLVLLGWKHGIKKSLSFALENGAHGGISPEECSAFVAVPKDVARGLLPEHILRPADLRRAAFAFQGRPHPPALSPLIKERREEGIKPRSQIRVMTYNVHACVGMDGRHDPKRIARVIAHCHPDIVALQELEHGHARSQGIHQAREIAELLRFEYHYHAVRELDDERFGNAILSRFPLKLLRAAGLPGSGREKAEARGALWVEADVEGSPIQVVNTHLGLHSRERILQVKALLGERWLGSAARDTPFIVCGDWNFGPNSPAYREMRKHFQDCQLQPRNYKARNTWMARLPLRRIDHIFVNESLVANRIEVPASHLASTASDHLPLVADISFRPVSLAPEHASGREGGKRVA